jgi:hypothetical protein
VYSSVCHYKKKLKGLGQVKGYCEYGNEPAGSLKCGEFLTIAFEGAELKV